MGGRGDRVVRGEGDLEGLTERVRGRHSLLISLYRNSWRSNGLGDLETAGVERGDSSLMSQYSNLISEEQ